MTLVWALELLDSEKIVLLALADCANDEGYCWPGMSSLVRKCSKGERTIQGVIKELCRKGHLTRREVPGKGCNYTVHPTRQRVTMEGYNPPESHYVYRITDVSTGEFYIGARSCFGPIEDDDYAGSGNWVKSARANGAALSKEVIEEVVSREALAYAELRHVEPVFDQALCKNAKKPTPGTLSRNGFRAETPAEIAPRRDCAPQPPRQPPQRLRATPAAAAGKPSENHQEPSNDSPSDDEPSLRPEHVFEFYQELAKSLGRPIPRDFTPERRALVRARIAQYSLADFQEIFARCRGSPFLRGDKGRTPLTFDWLMQKKNSQKVLEGNYEG